LFSIYAHAGSLDEYKSACEMIGFKPATPDFGDCVLELRRKDKDKPPPVIVQKKAPVVAKEKEVGVEDIEDWSQVVGDGSQEDGVCQQYGFKVGKPDYKQCRLNLDIAKREAEAQDRLYQQQVRQYNEQKRAYAAQVAEAERKKKAKDVFNLLMYGLNRAGGKTHDESAPALYGLPAYPKQPRAPIQPIPIQPLGGKTYQCSWDTWRKVYRCN
jgi:hypothetical protein